MDDKVLMQAKARDCKLLINSDVLPEGLREIKGLIDAGQHDQALAVDLDKLERLRLGLRRMLLQSDVCNASAYTRELEDVYQNMWYEFCDTSSVSAGICFRVNKNTIRSHPNFDEISV